MPDAKPQPHRFRFLTIEDVAEELATSPAQVRELIRRKELPALQIGERGQWRVERAKLEDYIQRAYEETQRELDRRRRDRGEKSDEDKPAHADQDYVSTDEDVDYRQEEGGEG